MEATIKGEIPKGIKRMKRKKKRKLNNKNKNKSKTERHQNQQTQKKSWTSNFRHNIVTQNHHNKRRMPFVCLFSSLLFFTQTENGDERGIQL